MLNTLFFLIIGRLDFATISPIYLFIGLAIAWLWAPRDSIIDTFKEGNKYGCFRYRMGKKKILVSARFDAVSSFREGYAGVQIGNKWGFIDKKGRMVIGLRFDGIGNFSSGLAAVKINSKWGYINKMGNIVIAPQFDGAGEFYGSRWYYKHGYSGKWASVWVGEEEGIIDEKLNWIVKPHPPSSDFFISDGCRS